MLPFISVFVACLLTARGIRLEIPQGELLGLEEKSRNGGKYFSFYGIPYAKPPVGEFRFQPPQPPESWSGVRDARKAGSVCAQMAHLFAPSFDSVRGEEDCLFVNVYTPDLSPAANLSVLVYIHGGAFLAGDGAQHDPNYFMDKRIVFVSINYRLGILGFLSTVDEHLPGNYGMKDQVAALKWVRKNIDKFGGNPDKITIFGNSAGGASVDWLTYSPLAKGLFHGAIAQSGSALSYWSLMPGHEARVRGLAVGALSGCSTYDVAGMVRCLRRIPIGDLLRTQNKFFVWGADVILPFPVVLEPRGTKGAFVTKSPWESEVVNRVPFVAGFNSGEGVLKVAGYVKNNGSLMKELGENYRRLLPVAGMYFQHFDYETTEKLTEKFSQRYFKNGVITDQHPVEMIDFLTDVLILHGTVLTIRKRDPPKYLYYYDHRNEISFSDILGYSLKEVCHSDELFSLFKMMHVPFDMSREDDVVSKKMVEFWVNFANTGNPNNVDDAPTWLPVGDKFEYLVVRSRSMKMEETSLKERFNFWENFNGILFKTGGVRNEL